MLIRREDRLSAPVQTRESWLLPRPIIPAHAQFSGYENSQNTGERCSLRKANDTCLIFNVPFEPSYTSPLAIHQSRDFCALTLNPSSIENTTNTNGIAATARGNCTTYRLETGER